MGKIKVRILGDETLENKQKEKARLASEAKRAQKKAEQKKFVKGAKGGERVVAVGPSEEELSKIVIGSVEKQSQTGKPETEKPKSENRKRKTDNRKGGHSKSYQAIAKIVDINKKYLLSEGLGLLEKLKRSKFDETVELHINTSNTGVSGNVILPHTTGKLIRVAIADPSTSSGQVTLDILLKNIEKGTIDFDILLASPSAMPKLARVAKILGPRGLMPNPKNATLNKDPEKAAEKFKKGQVNFKTELKAPIMHLTVGRVSFGAKKLTENIQTLLNAIKKENIKNITLKSTMSPGIKLDL